MASIAPFEALRPEPTFAKAVASLPYDVMNRKEAKQMAAGNPHSFLHITRSEISLPEATEPYHDAVYTTAADNLKAFMSRGILFAESKPCYYIYQLTMDGRSQTGIVALSSVEDYHNDIIRKHEFTRPVKENDRIKHIVTTGAQTGNVFMAYRDVEAIDKVVNQWKSSRSPVYDFVAEDGIGHTIWVVSSDEAVKSITEMFANQVPATYIADGHHRAASAAKAQPQFSSAAQRANGKWFLTTLFPANQLAILDYNRVIKDLNGLSHDEFFHRIAEWFEISLVGKEAYRPEAPHHFGLYIDGNWYKLVSRPGTWSDDPIGVLDITILSNHVLEKALGIMDQRTDSRIDFVGGIRGLKALQDMVDSGEWRLAFSLHPVTMEQLFHIADSGNVMPPKSTWFEPKLRDGLLTYLVGE